MAVPLAIFLVLQRFFVRGILAGSVKGNERPAWHAARGVRGHLPGRRGHGRARAPGRGGPDALPPRQHRERPPRSTSSRRRRNARAPPGRRCSSRSTRRAASCSAWASRHGLAQPDGPGRRGRPRAHRARRAALGTELRALGITVDYAPVCDLATNALNPAMGIRAFGDDPEHTAPHVAAFVRGLARAGVAATAKHFPGKGDVAADSHHGPVTLAHDRARFDAIELRALPRGPGRRRRPRHVRPPRGSRVHRPRRPARHLGPAGHARPAATRAGLHRCHAHRRLGHEGPGAGRRRADRGPGGPGRRRRPAAVPGRPRPHAPAGRRPGPRRKPRPAARPHGRRRPRLPAAGAPRHSATPRPRRRALPRPPAAGRHRRRPSGDARARQRRPPAAAPRARRDAPGDPARPDRPHPRRRCPARFPRCSPPRCAPPCILAWRPCPSATPRAPPRSPRPAPGPRVPTPSSSAPSPRTPIRARPPSSTRCCGPAPRRSPSRCAPPGICRPTPRRRRTCAPTGSCDRSWTHWRGSSRAPPPHPGGCRSARSAR